MCTPTWWAEYRTQSHVVLFLMSGPRYKMKSMNFHHPDLHVQNVQVPSLTPEDFVPGTTLRNPALATEVFQGLGNANCETRGETEKLASTGQNRNCTAHESTNSTTKPCLQGSKHPLQVGIFPLKIRPQGSHSFQAATFGSLETMNSCGSPHAESDRWAVSSGKRTLAIGVDTLVLCCE